MDLFFSITCEEHPSNDHHFPAHRVMILFSNPSSFFSSHPLSNKFDTDGRSLRFPFANFYYRVVFPRSRFVNKL